MGSGCLSKLLVGAKEAGVPRGTQIPFERKELRSYQVCCKQMVVIFYYGLDVFATSRTCQVHFERFRLQIRMN